MKHTPPKKPRATREEHPKHIVTLGNDDVCGLQENVML